MSSDAELPSANRAPLVSVIMNGHNAARFLREAIDSVIAQTYPNWEIILWDNASTDETPSIVESYAHKQIKYYRDNNFLALGEARNNAIRMADGKLLAFLDCDDLWLPEKLEKQVPLFDDQSVGIAICDAILFSEKGTRQLYLRTKPPTGNVFRELLGNYFISLGTAMVRRRVLDAMDEWFDPRFNMIEEADLFIRIAHRWRLAYVDQVLAKWRMHPNSWTLERFENFPLERELMLEKYERIFPDFTTTFREEVWRVRRTIAQQKAIVHWKCGSGARARQELRGFRAAGWKDAALFLATFAPYAVVRAAIPRLKAMTLP